jgi:hypothetical protein
MALNESAELNYVGAWRSSSENTDLLLEKELIGLVTK